MRIALLGVRGSTPAPGAPFVRFGGHSSCVAVLPDGTGPPALVLDAGTGLRELPALLDDGPFAGALVLTHLHWDHVQGLPFCPSVDRPDARVALHLPAPRGVDPGALLARGMSPPHFPIGPEGMLGDWSFHGTADGFEHAGMTVTLAEVAHRGTTHGIRIDCGGRSLAYLPDHSPATASPRLAAAAAQLAAGVDLLLHGGQYTAPERPLADAYGHATMEDALAFAARCGAKRLVLTHHSPCRTDDQLDAIARRWAPEGVSLAVQGAVVDVG